MTDDLRSEIDQLIQSHEAVRLGMRWNAEPTEVVYVAVRSPVSASITRRRTQMIKEGRGGHLVAAGSISAHKGGEWQCRTSRRSSRFEA